MKSPIKKDSNDKLNGLVKEYFKDGKLASEGKYVNGRKQEYGNITCETVR